MPKTQQLPQLATRLSSPDLHRFDKLAEKKGWTKAELAREAIRWYLDHQDDVQSSQRDSVYAKEIRKMTDRLVAFLVPMRREISALVHLSYYNIEDKRQLKSALKFAFDQMRKQLPAEERAIADKFRQQLEQMAIPDETGQRSNS